MNKTDAWYPMNMADGILKFNVLRKEVELPVEPVDQFQPEQLERQVPLAVPVSVGNKSKLRIGILINHCFKISSQSGNNSRGPSRGQIANRLFGMRADTAFAIAAGVFTSSVTCQAWTGTRMSSSRKPQGRAEGYPRPDHIDRGRNASTSERMHVSRTSGRPIQDAATGLECGLPVTRTVHANQMHAHLLRNFMQGTEVAGMSPYLG